MRYLILLCGFFLNSCNLDTKVINIKLLSEHTYDIDDISIRIYNQEDLLLDSVFKIDAYKKKQLDLYGIKVSDKGTNLLVKINNADTIINLLKDCNAIDLWLDYSNYIFLPDTSESNHQSLLKYGVEYEKIIVDQFCTGAHNKPE